MYDYAFRLFFVNYIENILYSQRLKVQFIGNIEVSGDGFRVVVDDNGFIAHFTQRPYTVYGAIVKFYALTNADRTGAQNYNLFLITNYNLILSCIAGIVIRSCSFKFSSTSINHFVGRQNAISLAQVTNFHFSLAHNASNYAVCKTSLFCLTQQTRSKLMSSKSTLHLDDIANLVQEPLVNLGNAVNLFNSNTTTHSLSNYKDTLVINTMDALFNLFVAQSLQLGHFQMSQTNFQGTDSFQQRCFKAAFNSHNLTGSLHLGSQATVCSYKFIEGPTGEFQNDVVNGRLKASLGSFGYSVFNFVQIVANCNLGGYFCNRIASCFGSQSRATAYTGVNFDHIVVFRIGIQSQLYITATYYAQLTNDVDGSLTEQLNLFIIQGLSRSNNDGVTGMYAYRVHVFHRANGDAVISSVANNLEFDFLPASNAAFNQTLTDGAVAKALLYNIAQSFFILSNAAASTAQSISRTNNQRIADFATEINCSLDSLNNDAFRNRLVDFFHSLLKQLTVFATFNSGDLGAQKTYVVFFQNALLIQLHSHVQTHLSAQGCQQRIRTFTFDDSF